MKKKIHLIVLLAFMGIFTVSNAQPYKFGVGVRLGNYDNNAGLTGKLFLANDRALEGILYFPYQGFHFTLLYKYQNPVPNVKGLTWFIGAGLHVANWDEYYYWKGTKRGTKYYYVEEDSRRTVFGLDFILGLEYTLKKVPFSFALDWKPGWNFNRDYNRNWGSNVALSIRYTF